MRFHKILGTATIMLFLGNAIKAQDLRSLETQYAHRLNSHLTQSIVPFWTDETIDIENGGYRLNHDIEGTLRSEGTKMVVTQSRMVWYFARLARAGIDPKSNLAASQAGFQFLKKAMWDSEYGGFYWEVNATGTEVLKPKKHLYGQSFALYGLSELYRVSRQAEVLDLANTLFDLIDRQGHDGEHGGYIESFERDWTQATDRQSPSYMGVPAHFKLMNTHLHLLESLTSYYRVAPSPRIRERLEELITIQSNTVVRKSLGACTDKYTRKWQPILNSGYDRVSYGHDLENIWLLMDACDALGIPHATYRDLYETLFDYSLRYGYDKRHGGFYDSGPFNQIADNRNKVWWVQAEAIVAALYLYRLTGKPIYRSTFEKTYDWIESHQLDATHGEWFSQVDSKGVPSGPKASTWKSAYHNGRALIECHKLLRP